VNESIFVSIASFRDPDCKNTISNLLQRAAHPELLSFGVCNQVIHHLDRDCLLSTSIAPRIAIDEVDASLSRGACWARSRIQKLWRNEDYYFQIDSHMRFVQGWDEVLINMLRNCPAEKAVLSTYPLTFTPPDTYGMPELVSLVPKWFDENGILTCFSRKSPVEQAPSRPQENYFVSAGLLFARSTLINEVPYDPHLYHVGEEISLAVRLWTHGWTLYTPNRVIGFHDYGKREDRSKHWKNDEHWRELDNSSKARVRQLLEIEVTGRRDKPTDFEPYGLGKVRSLKEYEEKATVNFALRMIGKEIRLPAIWCARSTEQRTARRTYFSSRGRYQISDAAPPPATTVPLMSWLLSTGPRYNIRSVCNLGCGVDLSLRDYVNTLDHYAGYDLNPAVIEQNRVANRMIDHVRYRTIDIVDLYPDRNYDLIVCTGVLEYLPLDAAIIALAEVIKPFGKFIVLTSSRHGKNCWIDYGQSYDIDLEQPPFSFPAPLESIELGAGIFVGLWESSQITLLTSTTNRLS
jgi:hypothetical protein